MEAPKGDLEKDDWEKVERVGYDWQEGSKVNDGNDDDERKKTAKLAITRSSGPSSKKSTERLDR